MSLELPAVRITTCLISGFTCATCGRRWMPPEMPNAFTVASIEAGDPPAPVCDDCIETGYPAETWDELRAERRRFERS